MSVKTVLKNFDNSDPAKYRGFNVAVATLGFALQARRYARERTVWNLLPLISLGLSGVNAAFRPGKPTE
jgi:hypothetical protein